MVNLLESAGDVGPAFLIGYCQGFLIGAVVAIVRILIKLFSRIVSGNDTIDIN